MDFLDEDEDFSEPSPAPSEEEDAPVETMEIGDDFATYVSIKDAPAGDPPPPPARRPPARASKKTFGILDVVADRLGTPPCFTEPETVQAMRRLGYIPDDLAQVTVLSFDAHNPAIRDKVLLELDRRRMQLIENVIAERNRIVRGDPTPPAAADGPPVARRKRKKAQPRRKRKRRTAESEALREEKRRVRELSKKMGQAEERLKKMAKEQQKKAEELRRARMKQAKKYREAAANYEKERMRKAEDALRRSDLIAQRIAEGKKEALVRRERERTERYRGTKTKRTGKSKKKQL